VGNCLDIIFCVCDIVTFLNVDLVVSGLILFPFLGSPTPHAGVASLLEDPLPLDDDGYRDGHGCEYADGDECDRPAVHLEGKVEGVGPGIPEGVFYDDLVMAVIA
jgi:hypothetical protein